MPSIPLLDLRAQYRAIKPEIDAAIQRVLDSGQFILGPEVDALEREVAAYCQTRYAVAVASGTDALELARHALDIGAGDDLITTAYSFIATAEAIVAVGAIPVFVDIELETYTLDVQHVARLIGPRTKALLPVHLYGHPCTMGAIMRLAKRHRLAVIEDCAQAIGARDGTRRVGAFGDVGALSFYPTKNLGAYGDAGMVVTNRRAVAERIRLLRAHGSRQRYRHQIVGTNSRLDELQAAILRVKLRHLTRWNRLRRAAARTYRALCTRYGIDGVQLPQERPGCEAVYHLYTIRTPKRNRLAAALARAGIATQVAYPVGLPDQPPLRSFRRPGQQFPQTQRAAREVLSLPLYPELRTRQIERIVQTLANNL